MFIRSFVLVVDDHFQIQDLHPILVFYGLFYLAANFHANYEYFIYIP